MKRIRLMKGLGRNVVVLGAVSLFTDISSEMLYPVVPLFLTAVLKAPMSVVGLIEGIAESTASLLKVASGWWSDRSKRRMPFVVSGYGLSAVSKPMLALAGTWHVVLGSRFLDRVGKGIRTSARDALLAASCDAASRGGAFGLHRAMDTAGAVFGPLAAVMLLSWAHVGYRTIFLLAFIPAAMGVAALSFVRERDVTPDAPRTSNSARRRLPARLWVFLVVMAVFALGNSSDVFLLLRSKDVGFSTAEVLGAYVLYNVVYAVSAWPAGWLADRVGKRGMMAAGFLMFGAVYTGFAAGASEWAIWSLFGAYGLYAASTEGVARAYMADLSPPDMRATAMGLLHTVTGVLAFFASVAAGLLWTHVSPRAPFVYGAACAAVAAALLLGSCRRSRPPDDGKEVPDGPAPR